LKKLIVIFLIISTALCSTSCYSSKYISKEDWLESAQGDIKVVTVDSTSYELREGWYEVNNDTIFIISKSKFNINPYGVSYIPLNQVKQLEQKEFQLNNTIVIATFGVVLLVAAVKFVLFLADITRE